MKMTTFFAKAYRSVKGIYLAIFLTLIITSSAFAQQAKEDKTAPTRWEVSLDLKPLFRKDEPYSLFVKRYLTEKKAVRVGLGLIEQNKEKVGNSQILEYLFKTIPSTSQYEYQYGQVRVDDNYSNSNTILFTLGYQYILSKKKVTTYIATDLTYFKTSNLYDFSLTTAFTNENGQPVFGGPEKTFVGYDPRYKLDAYSNTYSAKQIIGINYSFNKNISLSIETGFVFQYNEYSFRKEDRPYPDQRYEKISFGTGSIFNWKFNPLTGFYLNYHF